MKIVFVHEVNWRDKVTFEIHEIPELLNLRGHEVIFIDFPEFVQAKKSNAYRFRTKEVTYEDRTYRGSRVTVRTPGFIARPPIDRLLASLSHLPVLVRTFSQDRPDVIVLYSVPTNGWLVLALARIFRVPVVYRAIDVPHEIRKSAFRPLIKLCERYVYRKAQRISANNQALVDYCITMGARASKCQINYPGLDLSQFAVDPKIGDRREFGLATNDKVILYLGTFFRFAGIVELIDLLCPIMRSDPTIKFLLVGGGDAEDQIRDSVRRLCLHEQVLFTGFVPYEIVPRLIQVSDVGVVPFELSTVTHCALPWKAIQYVASGLPVVSTPLYGLQSVLRDGEGVAYRPLDNSYLEEIVRVINDIDYRTRVIDRGIQIVNRHFSWDSNIEKFENMLQEVAGGTR